MADLVPNSHQWPHTENANRGLHSLVMTSRSEDQAEMFLRTPIFATEKLDGTNVAKDDRGQVYSRRLKIGAAESHFQRTDLSSVRQSGAISLVEIDEILCSDWLRSYALKNQLNHPIRGISCLSLCLYGTRIGGFHAGKGSFIDAGVSNIVILSVHVHLSQCVSMRISGLERFTLLSGQQTSGCSGILCV